MLLVSARADFLARLGSTPSPGVQVIVTRVSCTVAATNRASRAVASRSNASFLAGLGLMGVRQPLVGEALHGDGIRRAQPPHRAFR